MELTPRERIKLDADVLYDLTEGLADLIPKLGAGAVSSAALLERLEDTVTVLQSAIMELQNAPAPISMEKAEEETTLSSTPLEETPLTGDEPLPLDSDETRGIVRRYFASRIGDLSAWDGLRDHLEKNGVIVPNKRALTSQVKAWMPEIEQELASFHSIDVRWTQHLGVWVVAEVAGVTPRPQLAKAEPTPVAEPVEQPMSTPAPAPVALEAALHQPEYTPELPLEALCNMIAELPPYTDNYARYNTLRNKLDLSEVAATRLIDHYCASGALFTFRSAGNRCVTPDAALAQALDTKPVGQGKKREQQRTKEETAFNDYRVAAEVTGAFLKARIHLERAMTYRELIESTGYTNEVIRSAVKFLKGIGIVSTELRPLSRSGHRSGSQEVQKVRLTSQALKDELKGLDLSSCIDFIKQRATAEQADDTTIAV